MDIEVSDSSWIAFGITPNYSILLLSTLEKTIQELPRMEDEVKIEFMLTAELKGPRARVENIADRG